MSSESSVPESTFLASEPNVENGEEDRSNRFDPIVDPPASDSAKYVIGDVDNEEAFKMYKDAEASFWTAEEIDLATDVPAFKKLQKNEQDFLLMVLAFFAGSDGIVLENLMKNLYVESQQSSVRLFYGFQVAIENIHSEVYSQLIKSFVSSREERAHLFRAIDELESVKAKSDWALRWIEEGTFGERIVAFAAVEGIFFSASFCAIFYFKKRGIDMQGLYASNKLIARDEGLHCQFACLIHNQLKPWNKCAPEKIEGIVRSAVEAEKVFVADALKHNIIGMNKELMGQYVEFVADVLLDNLGCKKVYKVKNPFAWMDMINVSSKGNFFETRETEYALGSISGGERVFKTDEDF